MGRWKYYSDEDGVGMSADLMDRVDHACELAGFKFTRTSGLRTVDSNAAAGGVQDSSHLKGLALDLAKPVGQQEIEKMLWALGLAGIRRVGNYDRHVHVDVDPAKVQDVMWYGKSH